MRPGRSRCRTGGRPTGRTSRAASVVELVSSTPHLIRAGQTLQAYGTWPIVSRSPTARASPRSRTITIPCSPTGPIPSWSTSRHPEAWRHCWRRRCAGPVLPARRHRGRRRPAHPHRVRGEGGGTLPRLRLHLQPPPTPPATRWPGQAGSGSGTTTRTAARSTSSTATSRGTATSPSSTLLDAISTLALRAVGQRLGILRPADDRDRDDRPPGLGGGGPRPGPDRRPHQPAEDRRRQHVAHAGVRQGPGRADGAVAIATYVNVDSSAATNSAYWLYDDDQAVDLCIADLGATPPATSPSSPR